MNSNSYRGVFTIPSTPFRENGEIDIPSFQRMIDFCIEGGSHGLVYPVNASEFTALSDAERFQMSEVLVKQNDGRLPVIIGVAGVTQEVAELFAKHALRYRRRRCYRYASVCQSYLRESHLLNIIRKSQMQHECQFSSKITCHLSGQICR